MKWPPKLSPLPDPDPSLLTETERFLLDEVSHLRELIRHEQGLAKDVEEELRNRKHVVLTLAQRYEDKVLKLQGQMELPFEEEA